MNFFKFSLIPLFLYLFGCTLIAQTTLEVTDQTIKIGPGSEEVLYFGFSEGDQIVFNLQEIDGKELKEVEVLEYPTASKFSDFKTVKIQDKHIQVSRTGIYKFRFFNGNLLSNRICKIHIARVPASEATKAFNTSVRWDIIADTTWNTYTKDVVVGYDTLQLQKTRRVLVNSDTSEVNIIDKSENVHSTMNDAGNTEFVFFTLPQNIVTPQEEKRVIAWAYWVGVGEESNQAWEKNSRAVKNAAIGAANIYLTPLGALAVGLVSTLITSSSGEDVHYELMDGVQYSNRNQGLQYRVRDQGTGFGGYKNFSDAGVLQGAYHVLLSNDNLVTPINVNVKVSAMQELRTFKEEPYTDLKITPRYEKQIMRDPIVKNRREPVMEK